MDYIGIIGLLVGIIGTGIAIYQTAIINESKKRKHELQYILAAINATSIQKQQAWQNQIGLLGKPSTPEEWGVARLHIRARDDATEIANLTSALEGTIDSDSSAIVAIMDKYQKIMSKSKSSNPVDDLGANREKIDGK